MSLSHVFWMLKAVHNMVALQECFCKIRIAVRVSVHLDSLQDSHTDTILVLAATGEMRHCTPKQTGRTY